MVGRKEFKQSLKGNLAPLSVIYRKLGKERQCNKEGETYSILDLECRYEKEEEKGFPK